MTIRVLLTAFLLLAGSAAAHAKDPRPVIKYPADYRTWTHLKSMVIFSDRHPLFSAFGGIHHVYVNRTGLPAAKAHGTYADGSVLVFDLLQIVEADGAYTEGGRKVLAVMQKDAKRFKATGGWGFEGFKSGGPGERLVNDPVGQCFNCHTGQKDHDYVFSTFRE